MRTAPPRSSIVLLVALVAAFAAPAAASAAQGQIIVKYAAGADAQDRSEARADADVVRDEALALPSTELVTPETGTSVQAAVADLERSDDVAYAEPDQPRHAFDLYPDEARVDEHGAPLNDQPFANLWAFHNTGQMVGDPPRIAGTPGDDIAAPAAWSVTTGSRDVTVAVVDSGVDRSHPDLFANLVAGYDFAYDDADPTDYDGHGTHVAGTIAARGNNGIGVTGVAWQTSLMPLQALDADGAGTITDTVDAYDYAANHSVRIVNASLGGDDFSWYEYSAMMNASNTLFVVAAGNNSANNDTKPSYPCAYNLPNIVCVAATDNNDRLAGFSNYGRTSVDIAAPGVNIFSTKRCDAYGYLSGTSMATPQVSGAAALVLAKHPEYTIAQLRGRLVGNTDPLASADAAKIASGGRLDVAKAVGTTLTQTTPPGSTTNAGESAVTTTVFAAPRTNEPAPPAATCPSAPVRSSSGPNPGGTVTPVTPTTPGPVTRPTPTTPAPAHAVTPAVDRTAPTLGVALAGRGALRALLAGRLKVATTASERATLRLELRLDARTAKKLHLTTRSAAVVLATGVATLTKAGTRSVTFRLTSRAKRALAGLRSVKVGLRATATDAAGNARTRSRTLTITR
jgi:subtilisin family serine protease